MKRYDRDYYRRWYRDQSTRIATTETLRRKVRLAVSTAEFLLQRPIRSVLDVGCGEALWRAELKRLRRNVKYVGVESSEYAIATFGRRRNVRRGDLGSLQRLGLRRPFDLVVCADVIQYVADAALRTGLAEMRRLTGGIAYIEAFAAEDSMEGDRDGWIVRSEATLRGFFEEAGFSQCGPYCWIDRRKIRDANRLEVSS